MFAVYVPPAGLALAAFVMLAEARERRALGALGAIALGFFAFTLALDARLLALPTCSTPSDPGPCAAMSVPVRFAFELVGSLLAAVAVALDVGGHARGCEELRAAASGRGFGPRRHSYCTFRCTLASMADEFVTVARLRAKMADVLAGLGRDRRPMYLTQRGQPRAVLMDIGEYRSLIDQLEHLDDSIEALLARERRDQGQETTRALAGVIADHRRGASAPTRKPPARGPRARVSR